MPFSDRDTGMQVPAAAPAGSAAVMPARCTSCAGGTLSRDEVKTAFWEGETLVVVEGIPALVCARCGERYYEDEVAMKLDLMRGAGFPRDRAVRMQSVPVFAFGAGGPDPGVETSDATA
ncbi:YgiT-type zinc finger domain-containing protein [Roseivivax lentus]|uniref:YgiT-type zinc finger domain-containing protein n=1 Tax=Roseivivax lentus TaxID=633194 RepID=A0A1N7NYG3_9RHOB|nr:type II toxin-antitoxin system MqsA family antitoxin [Roseivivax lentus]SIT03331.1 YgiT-type zinc finger domain-containing protein [Roseivivax lentus]